ncbi:MAG TPA: hypothetical protein VN577_21140 [Terriglobales bacterium]|nr:hypothetical protein [Terriglobales bacterium]
MLPEFEGDVLQAADIAESGRWAAINKRLEQQCANPGPDNAWWVQTLGGLLAQTFGEYLALKRAYADTKSDPSLLAWRARNLLELSVWCLYCTKNRDNTRRLYEVGRDVMELLNAFTKWGTATTKDAAWLDIFKGAKQNLSRSAAKDGVTSLDDPFKAVREAAEECGLGEHFRVANKMLSKFAHPTAMQILAIPDDQRVAMQRDMFFSYGCLYFTGAFELLDASI